jgi:maltokinase
VIDFEGEPGRSLPERRQRHSPLRDVAGMLRSFAYVEDAARLLRRVEAPRGWEERCREAFLKGYGDSVDRRLLPPSDVGAERLLGLFELQKLIYELRYELDNRPDWVGIPVAGLERLLEKGA